MNELTKDTCLPFFPFCKSFRVSSSQFPRLLCTRLNSSTRLVTRLETESAFCLILFVSTWEPPKMNEPYFLLTSCHTSLPSTCHHCLKTTIQAKSLTEMRQYSSWKSGNRSPKHQTGLRPALFFLLLFYMLVYIYMGKFLWKSLWVLFAIGRKLNLNLINLQ